MAASLLLGAGTSALVAVQLVGQPEQGPVQPQPARLVQLHHFAQQSAWRLYLAASMAGADRRQGGDGLLQAECDARLALPDFG